ncbi:MAG TPA: sensor histidine kinase [Elainellaceae cyanobacterium]
MEVLTFFVGLIVGLALLSWQKVYFDKKLNTLLYSLKLGEVDRSSLTSISQLSMAIAYQQKVREQLDQKLEVYQQIFYLAPIGYLQVDDENRLLWCNPQARVLLGISHSQIYEPRLLLEVVRSYDLDHLIDQTRSTAQPCQNDWMFYLINPDPSRIARQEAYTLRGYGFPLPDDHVGIFLENRQEAVVLKQQRDRWASDVAHELKTPLTSIRLVAETLQTRLDPPFRGWLTRLINETIRLSNLVQDLLDLGQLDRHSSDCLELVDADIVELVQSAWLNLEPLARKKNLELNYSGPERLIIQLDKQRIYRVLINLLDNAIKYSPPWKDVQVKLSTNDLDTEVDGSVSRQVLLEIIDEGPGFREVDLPFIFERFYRADQARSHYSSPDRLEPRTSSTPIPSTSYMDRDNVSRIENSDEIDTHRRGSSGLGLSIVQQIIEAHQGSVSANNHPETHGGWIRVCLSWRELKVR